MYEHLLEHYKFYKHDYDYVILRGRFAFTDTEIRLHHKSSSINVTMHEMPIYEGDYKYAPDLSPVNVLRLLHKIHSKAFIKIKNSKLYKLHVQALKCYQKGYTLEGFLAFQTGQYDVHSYRERLMTFTDDNSLSTYYLEVNGVNKNVGGYIVNQTLQVDSCGEIIGSETTKTKMVIYANDVMDGLTYHQIFDLFLQLDPVADSTILSKLTPYFRKRTIDDIFLTLDNAS